MFTVTEHRVELPPSFYRPWTVDRGPWMLVGQHITPDAGSLRSFCVGCQSGRTAHRQWTKVGHHGHNCGYAAQEWGKIWDNVKVVVGTTAQNTVISLQIDPKCAAVPLQWRKSSNSNVHPGELIFLGGPPSPVCLHPLPHPIHLSPSLHPWHPS